MIVIMFKISLQKKKKIKPSNRNLDLNRVLENYYIYEIFSGIPVNETLARKEIYNNFNYKTTYM